MKVYVLSCDIADDCGTRALEVKTYSTLKGAQIQMGKEVADAINNQGWSLDCYVKDFTEMRVDIYECGCWDDNHISWAIHETIIDEEDN